ncbi:MAG: M23 family metallopeptidase [Pirellulales bacterium]|nr:M23 family metallopeptidase [Pirellulales bacterium]
MDLLGGNGDDCRIEFESLQKLPVLRLYDSDWRPSKPIPLRRTRMAIRQVVEMRIAYEDLATVLPKEKAALLRGENARPWVRIRAWTWNAQRERRVDFGPTVASFRIVETPYALDPALPDRPDSPVQLGLPVRGQWLVVQGAFGSFSHQNVWAYDLVQLDATGHQSWPPESRQNDAYHGWGQPVYSPIEGRVLMARGQMADQSGKQTDRRQAVPNQVYIASPNGFNLDLVHLQQDSVSVRTGERVSAGRQVGLVGNSGSSAGPHLHVAAWQGRFPRKTVPQAWTNVRVGLNPGRNDPWARDLSEWEPREGFFVETVQTTGQP